MGGVSLGKCSDAAEAELEDGTLQRIEVRGMRLQGTVGSLDDLLLVIQRC
jgi:hypothetical protein